MASIVDVANAANVAPSTVSLVMNHRERVAPDTRKRVEEAMQRLGYRGRKRRAQKNETSRSLRLAFIYSPKTMYDGAVSVYIRELVKGVQSAIDQSSSTLSLIRAAKHVDADVLFSQQVESHEFDAALLLGPEPDDGYLQRLQELGLPLVVFNHWSPHSQFSSVMVDYYNAACLGVTRLLEAGHRDVAIVLENRAAGWPKDQVAEGARDTLAAAGLKPAADLPAMPRDDAQLAKAVQQVVDSKASALMVGDRFAEAWLEALENVGVSVPDDLSLLGFDGLGLASRKGVQLTSVGYDRQLMGALAVELLQKALSNPEGVKCLTATVAAAILEGD